jgi:hypothetical protein
VIGRILGNLIPKVMKVYSWGIPQTVVLTGCSINEQTVMESINVVIDDEEVEAPSSREDH